MDPLQPVQSQTPPVAPTPPVLPPQPQPLGTQPAPTPPPAPRKKPPVWLFVVIGLVVLALVGGVVAYMLLQGQQKTTSDSPASDTPASSTPTAVATDCLVPMDAHDFFDIDTRYLPTDVTTYFYSDSVFFKADSADYAYPDLVGERYDKLAEFYKKYSSRKFAFYIQATTYEENQSEQGQQVANARANIAKKELTTRGVPEDRISIEAARTSTYDAEAMRNVDIAIKGDASCAESTETQ